FSGGRDGHPHRPAVFGGGGRDVVASGARPDDRRQPGGGDRRRLLDLPRRPLRRHGAADRPLSPPDVAPAAGGGYLPRDFPNFARVRSAMAQQYIFQMQGLTKVYPGGKKVFENIWLSFYPDAKIGVVGVN